MLTRRSIAAGDLDVTVDSGYPTIRFKFGPFLYFHLTEIGDTVGCGQDIASARGQGFYFIPDLDFHFLFGSPLRV
jgi:hypothetical protein